MVRGVSWSIYWYLFMRSTDLNLSAPLTWVFWISLGVHYSPPPIPHCWESHNQNSYLKLKPHSIFRVTLFVWKKLRQTKAESIWKLNYKSDTCIALYIARVIRKWKCHGQTGTKHVSCSVSVLSLSLSKNPEMAKQNQESTPCSFAAFCLNKRIQSIAMQ